MSSTIDLGHRLGLSVVAEGVEDERTLLLLLELGCDQVRGFYVSRPLSAEQLATRLQAFNSLESRGDDLAA